MRRGEAFPVAAVLVAVALSCSACGGSEGPKRCTTVVSAEVCGTPSSLRGAEPVVDTWSPEPAPDLEAQPLVDGRYLQTARAHYCSTTEAPAGPPLGQQSVLEVHGCVMRATSVAAPDGQPVVSVSTFDYAADGALELTLACPGVRVLEARPYAFDGTRLLLSGSLESTLTSDPAPGCERLDIDTYELR